jgi:F-type H+-transporting ATPase subunit b
MTTLLKEFRFTTLIALAILGLAVFVGSVRVFAQNTAGEHDQTTSAQRAPANTGSSEKESGEDETTQFKHSASVKLISKITGLSLEGAYWLAVVLNFAIVAGLIVWAAKKNLPTIFRNRTAIIQKSLEEARRASEDANRRLSDIESRLGRLDQEIAKMRAEGEREAAAEEQRIKAAADEDARRIVESAQQEIDAAAKAARRELTAYAADLAVSLAAKQIHVDAPTDQALLRRFAQQLSRDGGTGGKA